MTAIRRPTPRSRPSGLSATARPVAAVLALLLPLLTAACLTVSRQEEIQMGREYSQKINAELPLIEEPAIRDPVSQVGHQLARVSPRPDLPYEFHVVNTNVINAFAVPGGFVYMNRGLIEASEDMSEVAGVLAHEVGHVVARHSAEQLERARRASLGLALGSIVFGAPSDVARLGVNVAANLYFAKHSREDEAEADRMAVDLMVESGWHPCGLVDFFLTMLEERENKPGALQSLFASHPLTEERIRSVEALIDGLPPQRLEGLRDSSPAYRSLTSALRNYPPPPKKYRVDEQKEQEDGDEPIEAPALTGVCADR